MRLPSVLIFTAVGANACSLPPFPQEKMDATTGVIKSDAGMGGARATGGVTGTGGTKGTGGTIGYDAGYGGAPGYGGVPGYGGTTGYGGQTGMGGQVGLDGGGVDMGKLDASADTPVLYRDAQDTPLLNDLPVRIDVGIDTSPRARDGAVDTISAVSLDSAVDTTSAVALDTGGEATGTLVDSGAATGGAIDTGGGTTSTGGNGGPVKPANLSIKREDDTTRQVRLSWDYPSAVDIYIHNGDANGYYVESFSGATIVSGVTSGIWLDTDAPSHQARYYRVRAADTGQYGVDTLAKWDFDLGPFTEAQVFSFPAVPLYGDDVLSKLIGAQVASGDRCYKRITGSSNTVMSTFSGSAWDEDLVFSNTEGFWLQRIVAPNSMVVTTAGRVRSDVSAISVPAAGLVFWATGYLLPLTLQSIDLVSAGAHAGTNKDNADNIEIVFDPASGTWTGTCWLNADGHWYWNADNSSCDNAELLPGRGYWYQSRGAAFTFTIPKTYSNP